MKITNSPSSTTFLLVGTVGLLSATLANAVVIDIGPANQRVEPGALDLPGAPAALTNGTNYGPTLIGSGITVTINNIDQFGATTGGIDWRDRGDSTSSDTLVLLGEDFVKNNAGIVRLTLSGIAAGIYDATAYHVDPDNDQSPTINVFTEATPGSGTFAVTGTPGNSDFNIGGVNNLTTANVAATQSTFQFTSNGTDPVIIIFDGRFAPDGTAAGDTEVPLNGIEFNVVPEPSSALLTAFGLLALTARRRRA